MLRITQFYGVFFLGLKMRSVKIWTNACLEYELLAKFCTRNVYHFVFTKVAPFYFNRPTLHFIVHEGQFVAVVKHLNQVRSRYL